MARFAYDDDQATHTVPIVLKPRSETRIRVPFGYGREMGSAAADLAATSETDELQQLMTYLRAVQRAAADVEARVEDLGASYVTRAWLTACVEWFAAVTSTLTAAFSYEGSERQVALELAAEESSMRLLMRLEREGSETVNVLRNLDGNAARAASELASMIDLTDRALHELTVGHPMPLELAR